MGFPNTIDVLGSRIIEMKVTARTASDEAKRYKQKEQENQEMVEILEGLQNSWQDPDPGKYSDAFFFINADLCKRVVVREFLADDVEVCRTKEEWNEYLERQPCRPVKYEKVPYKYSVVGLSHVGKGRCEKCQQMQPVILLHVQISDSPEGDQWLKEYFVFCLDCCHKTTIKSEKSPNRLL